MQGVCQMGAQVSPQIVVRKFMADSSFRIIKKYPNRRLYDTETSGYITLEDVRKLVLANQAFKVLDAKTEEDLTRSILLQIILEEEAGGTPLFSAPMLSQMIRFYGNAMQSVMGSYLEKTMQAFVEIQANVADQSKVLGEGKLASPELWTQFMSMQAPMVQSMMGQYVDQSKTLFVQMQEQMQSQTRNMFQGFPFPGAPVAPSDEKKPDKK
jgi:polyhydroxyalkanoate synthesis repressor PhaR